MSFSSTDSLNELPVFLDDLNGVDLSVDLDLSESQQPGLSHMLGELNIFEDLGDALRGLHELQAQDQRSSLLLQQHRLGAVPHPNAPADGTARKMPESKQTRRADRREKNREAARSSRQKKKEYMGILEDQVRDLSAHVSGLRLDREIESRAQSRNAVMAMIGRGAFREALEQFGPGAASRRRLADYRFECLIRNTVPAHLRVLAWSVTQRAENNPNWGEWAAAP
jgi:hypothetical protein